MIKTTRETRQKEIINSQLNKINHFFTAEELHEKVTKIEPKIGIATIYRFIKELKKKNEIYSYLCNRRNIFSKNKESHCHFICEKTGKTIHFEINNLDFLKNKIPGSIKSFQIEIRGVCHECSAINDKHKH
jgi:Fur family ferric uptake transcriptional regulator